MTSPYEIEHNIKEAPKTRSRRPDMSSFFSQISQIQTSSADSSEPHNNPHATPTPADILSLNSLIHSQMTSLQSSLGASNPVIDYILTAIQSAPDEQIDKGVPQSYLDELERIPNNTLRKTDTCPICTEPFLDDEYPLVVVLPCHASHRFHLECVGPWLRLNGTCPLDRKELMKKKVIPMPVDDDEEEFDDMYA